MEPDPFQEAWQSQPSQARLTPDGELLLEEVRCKQKRFNAMIFWRDVREVGVAFALVPLWLYMGVRQSSPWTWYLTVPVLLWIAGFMLAFRIRYNLREPGPGEPLRRHVETSLTQVDHQIWLLRNVFWWALLPLAVSSLAFIGQVAWRERSGGWWMAVATLEVVAIIAVVFAVIYWLNQHAVRHELEPRRRELETLLMNLKDEPPAAN